MQDIKSTIVTLNGKQLTHIVPT